MPEGISYQLIPADTVAWNHLSPEILFISFVVSIIISNSELTSLESSKLSVRLPGFSDFALFYFVLVLRK